MGRALSFVPSFIDNVVFIVNFSVKLSFLHVVSPGVSSAVGRGAV